MKLLVFAHRGEAQEFIRQGHLSPQDAPFAGLFANTSNPQFLLLITGEGTIAATQKVAAILALNHSKPIEEVINYGVAGALSAKGQMGEIYSIRTVYAQSQANDENMEFKSFTSSDAQARWDCLSAGMRVQSEKVAKFLSAFAPLVDRELWGIASSCHLMKIPFRSFKLISDNAGADECLRVAQKAQEYSQLLYDHFSQLNDHHHQHSEREDFDFSSLQEEFYLTFSQKKNLESLLKKISLKEKTSSKEILASLPWSQWQNSNMRPKERSKMLLHNLKRRLSPFMVPLEERLQGTYAPYTKAGGILHFTPHYEDQSLHFSALIQNPEQFLLWQQAVVQFPYNEIMKLLSGDRLEI